MSDTKRFKLKHPVVLVHGLGAPSSFGPVDYFHRFRSLLTLWGNEVFIAELPFWHGLEQRAQDLKDQIHLLCPNRRVNLICHSMGGVDARYMAAQLGMDDHIESITTIGAPHEGTSLAEVILKRIPEVTWKVSDQILNLLGLSHRGFEQMGTSLLQNPFKRVLLETTKVPVYSVAGKVEEPRTLNALPVFWKTHSILKGLEGDNDGFVSVKSASYGNVIGVYPLDHYRQIGHFIVSPTRWKVYIQMLEDIVTRLVREGH